MLESPVTAVTTIWAATSAIAIWRLTSRPTTDPARRPGCSTGGRRRNGPAVAAPGHEL